jgi:hypothetical protein
MPPRTIIRNILSDLLFENFKKIYPDTKFRYVITPARMNALKKSKVIILI